MYLNTLGSFEDRIRNLHFIYAAVIRAVNRADPLLREYNYKTGIDEQADAYTHQLIDELLKHTIG